MLYSSFQSPSVTMVTQALILYPLVTEANQQFRSQVLPHTHTSGMGMRYSVSTRELLTAINTSAECISGRL